MKTLFSTLLFIISVNLSFSQYNEWVYGEIYFKDGERLEGLIRLKINGQQMIRYVETNDKVRYKADIRTLSKYYKAKSVDSLKVYDTYVEGNTKPVNGFERNATFIVINKNKNGSKRGFAELLIDGKVRLVRRLTFPKSGDGVVSSVTEKLLSRDNEKAESLLPYLFKNFNKWGAEYFKDCPELALKIKNEAFTRQDVVGIVNYYNTKCFNE